MSERASEEVMANGSSGTRAAESAGIRAYVNERGVSVAPGATALEAVRAFSPELARDVAAGVARLTDSRGLPIDASHVVHGGLILRVLPVRVQAARGPEDPAE